MKLDISKPENLTEENVASLLASADDSDHRQLRVKEDGTTYIAGPNEDDGTVHLFVFETWRLGSNQVGTKAAVNDEWVRRITTALRENWPNPISTLISAYSGQVDQ
jgi:hypothetical protein